MIPDRPFPQRPSDDEPSYQERVRAAEKAVDLVAATLDASTGIRYRD